MIAVAASADTQGLANCDDVTSGVADMADEIDHVLSIVFKPESTVLSVVPPRGLIQSVM